MKEELVYLVIISEILSLFIFFKVVFSRDNLIMKIILSIFVFIPIIGPIAYFFSSGFPEPQPLHFQNRGDSYSNVPMRGEYTDRWQPRIEDMRLKIIELEGLIDSRNESWVNDKTETEVGVHLLLANGENIHVSSELKFSIIKDKLNSLDWINNFYQFVVVTQPGVSMEVGGSLNGVDGLSAMYRNRQDRVDAVIKNPPESFYEMEKILEEFLKPNNVWMQKYDFEFTYY